jgi:hypothetical protein
MNYIHVAAFLKRHLNGLKADVGPRARERLVTWLAWHLGRNHVCVIKKDNKIVAAGVARAVNRIEEIHAHYGYNDFGSILHVERLASKDPEGIRNIMKWARARWPFVTQVCFHRPKNGNKLRLYSWDQVFMKFNKGKL